MILIDNKEITGNNSEITGSESNKTRNMLILIDNK